MGVFRGSLTKMSFLVRVGYITHDELDTLEIPLHTTHIAAALHRMRARTGWRG